MLNLTNNEITIQDAHKLNESLIEDYIRQHCIEFLDEIRNYEREIRNFICDDERESSEFVDIFLNEKEVAE
jgi:hypothetical protein